MDNHEKLPDEEQGEADHDDPPDHARHDGDDVGPFSAACNRQEGKGAATCAATS